MKSLKFPALAALASLMMTSPVMAEELRLEPSSKWQLHGTENSCTLLQAYGTGEDELVLSLENFDGGPFYEVSVSGKNPDLKQVSGFRWAGKDEPESISPQLYALKAGGSMLIFNARYDLGAELIGNAEGERPDPSVPPENDANVLRQMQDRAEGLFLAKGDANLMALMTGKMGAPLAAMRSCTDALVADLGVDPTAFRDRTRSVAPKNYHGWTYRIISGYPPEAIRANEEGSVSVVVLVGENGRVESCHVRRNLASERLAEHSCQGMLRYARFDPALGPDGKPIKSLWSSTMHYFLD